MITQSYYQQGATLIVGMITLFVMSLVAVTSMQNSATEEKIVFNTQNHNLAFHGAESTVAVVSNDLNILVDALNNGESNANIVDLPDDTTTGVADVGYVATEACTGESLEVGGKFACYHFEIEGSASINNTNIRSTSTQGISVKAPNLDSQG